MILTIKPFGAIDSELLGHLQTHLARFGEIRIALPGKLRPSFARRGRRGRVQYRASAFERACTEEPGDRVLAVTDMDLFEQGLNFVFGHATIQGRFAVVSIARFGNDGRDRLLERTVKTAIHEIGHTFGLYHDDANSDCVMHFSEKLEDTDRKSRDFCAKCAPTVAFSLSRIGT